MTFSIEPVGIIHSCFSDKFGVPRQSRLVASACARLQLLPPYNRPEVCAGLEGYSHVWISFVFHHCLGQRARLSVRPPRLGGNRRVGVFASRATHRPNPIGLSVVALAGVERGEGGVSLLLRGVDLVNGTPVLDIKPYLATEDAVAGARADYAAEPPEARFQVRFSVLAQRQCRRYAAAYPDLPELIEAVLSLDPRPAYHAGRRGAKPYVVTLYGLDVRWSVVAEHIIEVDAIEPAERGR